MSAASENRFSEGAADNGAILSLRGLRHEAGGRTILDIPAFDVPAGGMLAVLGPNGAGKSTLLRILAGLRRPSSGRLIFDGVGGRVVDDTTRATGARRLHDEAAAEALRRSSAFVFQSPYLWAGSVRRNLALGLRFRGIVGREASTRIVEIARQLGLDGLLDRNAGELSGGEAQRVALARALVLEPRVLFLDEPSANLDAEAHAALREDLDRVARERAGTIVLATHDRSDAFYLADSIAVLRDGRLVQAGSPSDLFENPADSFVAGITGAELALRGTVVGAAEGLLTVRVGAAPDGDPTGAVSGLRDEPPAAIDLLAVGTAGTGRHVKLAYRPEDLFLSREAPSGGSARNRFPARVAEIRPVGGLVRVRLVGPAQFVAVVTRAAADELELREGRQTWVQIKATALHAFEL